MTPTALAAAARSGRPFALVIVGPHDAAEEQLPDVVLRIGAGGVRGPGRSGRRRSGSPAAGRPGSSSDRTSRSPSGLGVNDAIRLPTTNGLGRWSGGMPLTIVRAPAAISCWIISPSALADAGVLRLDHEPERRPRRQADGQARPLEAARERRRLAAAQLLGQPRQHLLDHPAVLRRGREHPQHRRDAAACRRPPAAPPAARSSSEGSAGRFRSRQPLQGIRQPDHQRAADLLGPRDLFIGLPPPPPRHPLAVAAHHQPPQRLRVAAGRDRQHDHRHAAGQVGQVHQDVHLPPARLAEVGQPLLRDRPELADLLRRPPPRPRASPPSRPRSPSPRSRRDRPPTRSIRPTTTVCSSRNGRTAAAGFVAGAGLASSAARVRGRAGRGRASAVRQ